MGETLVEEVGYILGVSYNEITGGEIGLMTAVIESKSSSVWNWMRRFVLEMLARKASYYVWRVVLRWSIKDYAVYRGEIALLRTALMLHIV